MRIKSQLVLAVLAAAALLALAVGGASARSFSVTERNFELIWNNILTGKTKLTFGDRVGHHVECNLTMLGRYASNTIGKRTEINQGTINHGEVEGCVNGSATIRTETMPWELRYRSFTGRLPTIETITTSILHARWRVFEEASGLSCIAESEAAEPAIGIIEGGALENIRAERSHTIILEGGILCGFASPGFFEGRGLIQNLPRTRNITVTLI